MITFYKIQDQPFENYFIRKELFTHGGLWTWGQNTYGALGDNTITHRSSPVQTIAGGTNWKSVSGGNYHTAAIKTDGTLWSWGHNSYGQLGDETITHRSSPVQTVAGGTDWKLVACGAEYTAAIKTNGTLWSWGSNFTGALGDNTGISKSSPVQTVAGGTNWKSVACGSVHTAAIKTDGTLWTWGFNDDCPLGDGTIIHRSSPVQTVAAGTNWKTVSCGGAQTLAIKTDGTLWTWGSNSSGQLGDGTESTRSSPVQTITGGTNWKSVDGSRASHTLAIKTDGTLWTWGRNDYGQLGDGTVLLKLSPIQTIASGTNWKLVTGGYLHTIAIKTDGTLWTWGSNISGQLGDETITHRSSPVQTVAGGTNWKSVACGRYHNIVIQDNT